MPVYHPATAEDAPLCFLLPLKFMYVLLFVYMFLLSVVVLEREG